MPAQSPPVVTRADLDRGFERFGLRDVQIAVVHSSLSAFGWIEGGAPTVIDALREPVPTIVVPAFVYASHLPTPPGMSIPNNSDAALAADWPEFERARAATPSHRSDLPLDKDMGAVALYSRSDSSSFFSALESMIVSPWNASLRSAYASFRSSS